MKNFKNGEIIQLTHNVKVLKSEMVKIPGTDKKQQSVHVHDLDRDIKFYIEGEKLTDTTVSADSFERTEKLGKIALVEKLINSNGKVLSLSFNKENGEERVLIGIFQSQEPLMGRSYCRDLSLKQDDRPRLVNHREINWLILDGVKYIKK